MKPPQRTEAERIAGLADEVEAATGFDNDLDVRCEIALFEPNHVEAAIRPNAAGTKVIVTLRDGRQQTFIAHDYTINADARADTVAVLRRRALILALLSQEQTDER